MSEHAKLAASAASRWTACPASGYLTEDDSDSTDARGSVYAAEGTAAHFLVEECIRRTRDGDPVRPGDFLGRTIVVGLDEEGHTQSFFAEDHHTQPLEGDWTFEVTPEMVEASNVFIQATEDALLTLDPDGTTYVEEKTSPGHPDLGGTLDWGYVSGNRAAIADLKYGRGIVVDVFSNPQQMIYALGLIARHPEIEYIDTYIIQPRAPHADGPIRVCSYTATELVDFYMWLLECVEAAQDPDAPRVAGEHCRFCPELATCPATFELAQAAAAMEFGEEDQANTGYQLADAMVLTAIVETWVKAVRKSVQTLLMDGREVPGYKLVNGRGSRVWTVKEAAVIKTARAAGLLKASCFSVPKLLSPHAIETAAAKGGKVSGPAAKLAFKPLWESVPGGPTIAAEDDPRRPYRSSAEEDFTE